MMVLVIVAFLGAFVVVLLLMRAFVPAKPVPQEAAKPARRLDGAQRLQVSDFRKTSTLSAVPWFNRILQGVEIGPRVRALLTQAAVNWTAGKLVLFCISGFAFSTLLMIQRVRSVPLCLLVGLALGSSPFLYVLFKRKRRFAKFEEELPHALDMMVSALRAGHSFNAALGLASRECGEPVRGELKVCFEEQNYGLELSAAIENLVDRVPLSDLRIATTAILIQKETGGNLAEVLNNTADVIRERFRLKRQVRVHTAHGRLTGWAISIIPIALLLVLYMLNPEMESVLWRSELGIKLLCGAGAMMVLGFLVIQKIVKVDY